MAETKYPPNPLPCGCGAVGTPEPDLFAERLEYRHVHVQFCLLHAAAPKLLEALDNCVKLLEPDCSLEDMMYRAKHGQRMLDEARAAIAEARGKG